MFYHQSFLTKAYVRVNVSFFYSITMRRWGEESQVWGWSKSSTKTSLVETDTSSKRKLVLDDLTRTTLSLSLFSKIYASRSQGINILTDIIFYIYEVIYIRKITHVPKGFGIIRNRRHLFSYHNSQWLKQKGYREVSLYNLDLILSIHKQTGLLVSFLYLIDFAHVIPKENMAAPMESLIPCYAFSKYFKLLDSFLKTNSEKDAETEENNPLNNSIENCCKDNQPGKSWLCNDS